MDDVQTDPRSFGEIMMDSAADWKRDALKRFATGRISSAEESFRKALICERNARQYFANVANEYFGRKEQNQ